MKSVVSSGAPGLWEVESGTRQGPSARADTAQLFRTKALGKGREIMRLCLVEDLAAAGLEPLTLTRPVHELWLGCSTLGCKIAKAFGVGPGPQRRGGVIRSHLVPVQRQRDPHLRSQ